MLSVAHKHKENMLKEYYFVVLDLTLAFGIVMANNDMGTVFQNTTMPIDTM